MEKHIVLKNVIELALLYHENLENKNILFIYDNPLSCQIEWIESCFLSRHFLHLTGVKSPYSSRHFYRMCLKHKIKLEDIMVNHFVPLKLRVLNSMIRIHKNAKMIGKYNHNRIMLNTQLLIGNVQYSLGLVNENKYYVPNTLLKEDIRNVIEFPQKVNCILEKKISEKEYQTITYFSNVFDQSKLIELTELKKKIRLS